MQYFWVRVLILGCVLFPSGVQAENISKEQNAALNELFIAMKMDEQLARGMKTMVDGLMKQVAERNPRLTEDVRDQFVGLFLEVSEEYQAEFRHEFKKIYARNFSVQDIKDLTDFYSSPAGKKFVKRQPRVTQEGFDVGSTIGKKIGAEVARRIQSSRY